MKNFGSPNPTGWPFSRATMVKGTASRCVCCRSRLSTTSGVLPGLRHHCS